MNNQGMYDGWEGAAALQLAQNNSVVQKDNSERLDTIEEALRAAGILPPLELDPEPWTWQGTRFGTEDRPEMRYVRVFQPRKGYEQDKTKYVGDEDE